MINQKPGTFNIMRKLKIGEVSSVDRPAQGDGARMEIMKRAEPVEKKHALTDPMDGHAHILHGFDENTQGETSMAGSGDDYHTHPWILGQNGELIVGASNGHTHRVGFFSKQAVADVLDETHFTQEQLSASSEQTQSAADSNPQEEITMNEEQFNEKIAEIQKQLDESNARAERAELVSKMSDVQKAFYAGLEGDAQEAFLKSEDQDGEIAKAAEVNPVVGEFEGKEIRKSDDPTGVLTALLAKAKMDKEEKEKDEKEKMKLKFEAKKADLEKRASGSDYENLPGTVEVKAEMLKALDSIEDEAVRKSAHEALVAKNTELASAFEEVGTVGAPDPIAKSLSDKLDVMRDAILKAEPELTKNQAYVKAIQTPEGLEIYSEMQNPQEAV